MDNQKVSFDDLFKSPKKTSKKTEEHKNLLKTENVKELKRKRDDATESMRKKDRENKFRSRRMADDPEAFQSSKDTVLPAEPSSKEIVSLLSATVLKFKANDQESNLEALKTIRQLLSYKQYTPIQEAIDLGLVPILLTFAAQDKNHKLQVVLIVKH